MGTPNDLIAASMNVPLKTADIPAVPEDFEQAMDMATRAWEAESIDQILRSWNVGRIASVLRDRAEHGQKEAILDEISLRLDISRRNLANRIHRYLTFPSVEELSALCCLRIKVTYIDMLESAHPDDRVKSIKRLLTKKLDMKDLPKELERLAKVRSAKNKPADAPPPAPKKKGGKDEIDDPDLSTSAKESVKFFEHLGSFVMEAKQERRSVFAETLTGLLGRVVDATLTTDEDFAKILEKAEAVVTILVDDTNEQLRMAAEICQTFCDINPPPVEFAKFSEGIANRKA